MKAHTTLLATAVLALLLTACSESSKPAGGSAAAPATADTSPAPVAAAAVAAVTGIADWDNFLSAYEQCITEHAPAQARDQLKTGIDQWKSAWQTMASNDATKASLPQICKQARDSSAPALQAYGCTL